MLQYFVTRVIGGRTGKRESAWFVFILFAAWTGFLNWVEFAHGVEMDQASSMWMVLAPFVMAWVMGAHGLEWRDQAGPRRLSATGSSRSVVEDLADDVLDPLPEEPTRPRASAPNGPPPAKPSR